MLKFLKNKKMKYGSLGFGLTVAVVALVIVVNVIVSALVYNCSLYFDMTSEKLYMLSDETKEKINKIDGSCNNITVYFLTDEDSLGLPAGSSNYSSQSTLWGMKYILSLAKELSDEYDFIDYDFINISTEPDRLKAIVGDDKYDAIKFAKYYVLIDNYTVVREDNGSVINGTDGKPLYYHNFRIYTRNNFYSFDYGASSGTYYVNAFKGDFTFCSAMMSLCEATVPTAYFISGHGESVGSYAVGASGSDYGYSQYLWQMLWDSGFNVKKIDLQHEEFGNESNAVVVIFDPETDYTGNSNNETHNELGKLEAFLKKENHSLMVFLDYGTQELPNLEAFIKENCGVSYENALIKDSGANAIDVNRLQVVGSLAGSESAGGALTSVLAGKADAGKLIFTSSRPIIVNDSTKAGAAVLAPTSATAYYQDKEVSYLTKSPAALVTWSKLGDSSYALCAGTSFCTDLFFTDSPIYNNKNLFLSAFSIMADKDVPIGAEYKIMPSEGLDITKKEAITAMIIISVIVPLAVAAVGTVVYIRRRHS